MAFLKNIKIRYFLYFLLGLLLTVLFLQSNMVSLWCRDILIQEVDNRTPYTIDMVKFRIRPLQFGVELHGVQIKEQGTQVALIPRTFIGFRIPITKPVVRSVVLENPQFFLDYVPDATKTNREIDIPWSTLPNIQLNSANISISHEEDQIHINNVNFVHTTKNTSLWLEDTSDIHWGGQEIYVSPFRWDEIYIEDTGFHIEDIDVFTSMLSFTGAIALDAKQWNGGISAKFPLHNVQSTKVDLSGVADLDVYIQGPQNAPEISVHLITDVVEAIRHGETRDFLYHVDSIDAALLWKEKHVEIERSLVYWGGGYSVIEGRIHPSDNFVSITAQGIDQTLYNIGQDVDMSSAPWVDMDTQSWVQLEGRMSPLLLEGDIRILGQEFVNAGGDVRSKNPLLNLSTVELSGRVQLTNTDIQADLHQCILPKGQGTIQLNFQFPSPNYTTISYQFPVLDLSMLRPLGGSRFVGVANLQGTIEGPLQQLSVQSTINARKFSMLDFAMTDAISMTLQGDTLKDIDIHIPRAKKGNSVFGGDMRVQFASEIFLDGELQSIDGYAKDFMSIFFSPLDVQARVTGGVSIHGPVSNVRTEAQFSLREISAWGELFDTGEFTLYQDAQEMTIEGLSLQRNDGIGSGFMRGSRKNGENNFEIMLGGLPIEHFSLVLQNKYLLRGRMDLFANIRGKSFIPAGTIRLRDVWYDIEPLGSGDIVFFEQDEHIEYKGRLGEALSFHGTSGYSLDENYTVFWDLKKFPIHALYPQIFDGEWVQGNITATGNIHQRDRIFGGHSDISQMDIGWRDRALRLGEPVSVTFEGSNLEISPFHIVGNGGTDFTIQGTRQQKANDFRFSGVVDTRILEMVFPGTERATGLASIDGYYDTHGPNCSVQLQDVFIKGSWFPHEFENISLQMQIHPHIYNIRKFSSVLGGGTLVGSGTVAMDDWSPTNYELTLELDNGRIQLLDFLPPVVGDGQFRVAGPASYPMVSGSVQVEEMVFSDRIDWESDLVSLDTDALVGASDGESKGYFQYDINLQADNTIRIRNNVADVYASANLKFLGDLAKPGMLGVVNLSEQGRALFKERDFSILRGEIRYEDPFTFDPLLDIAMQTSVTTPQQTVKIDYFVTGLYSNWQTYTTSSPMLPQADINALLLFGMTRKELEAQGGLGSALAIEGSDLVASTVAQKFTQIGVGIFEADMFLDRIDLISGPTDRNSAYVSSALRLLAEKDIADGTLRVEQNLTEASDIFVSWEQKLSQRLYTRAYWASKQQGRYINNNGAFGMEIEVQWELE